MVGALPLLVPPPPPVGVSNTDLLNPTGTSPLTTTGSRRKNRDDEEAEYVYRALNRVDTLRALDSESILPKQQFGPWTHEEHIEKGSRNVASQNDPWIATTDRLEIAKIFNSSPKGGWGIIKIDLKDLGASGVIRYTDPSVQFYKNSNKNMMIRDREISISYEIPSRAWTWEVYPNGN